MAVVRNSPKCPKCGEPIKGIYRPQSLEPSNYFFGDFFQGWDFSGHVCDPDKIKNSAITNKQTDHLFKEK